MDNGHLSDEQIQEILDAPALARAAVLPWHIETCRICRERYRSFQRLYAGLAADPGFALPPQFADAVLGALAAPGSPFFRRRFLWVALGCAAGALALAGLLVFVDLKPLAQGWLRAGGSLRLFFRPLAGQLRELPSWFGGSAKLFIYGGLGLLGASLFEQFLRRQWQHRGH